MTSPIKTNPSIWLSMGAGAAAHGLEVATLGHFLDRLKVDREANLGSTHFRAWGRKEIFKGLRWNILSSSMKGSCGWAVQNVCNRIVLQFFPQKVPSAPSFVFLAGVGVLTGTVETSLILCPLERLKTVEMTSHSPFPLLNLIRNEGILTLYQGWGRMMVRQNVSWSTYLGAYQFFR